MPKPKSPPWWEKLIAVLVIIVLLLGIYYLEADAKSRVNYFDTKTQSKQTRIFHFHKNPNIVTIDDGDPTPWNDPVGKALIQGDFGQFQNDIIAAWFLDRLSERKANLEYQFDLEHKGIKASIVVKKNKGFVLEKNKDNKQTLEVIQWLSRIFDRMENTHQANGGMSVYITRKPLADNS